MIDVSFKRTDVPTDVVIAEPDATPNSGLWAMLRSDDDHRVQKLEHQHLTKRKLATNTLHSFFSGFASSLSSRDQFMCLFARNTCVICVTWQLLTLWASFVMCSAVRVFGVVVSSHFCWVVTMGPPNF